MSLHSWTSIDDFAPRSRAGEIISSYAAEPHVADAGIMDFPPLGRMHGTSPGRDEADVLSIHLGYMDVTLAVSALDQPKDGRAAGPVRVGLPAGSLASPNVVHFAIANRNLARRLGPTALRDEASGGAPAAANDPVVQRLSQALVAAEGSEDEFGGIYADAVRLAIVARMLSVPSEAEPEVEPSTGRRQKAALPKWRFKRVAEYVAAHLDDSITLADMASAAGLSRMHFAAQFRLATGMRPHEFVLRRRIEKAQEMLLETGESLVAIALDVGFQTQAHFTTVFKRFVGDTPHQWRCAHRRAC